MRFKEYLQELAKSTSPGLAKACWPGYVAVGTKLKNGRRVPNCIPKKKK